MSNKLHDDFETDVWNRSMTTGMESYTAAIQILLERVVALEERQMELMRHMERLTQTLEMLARLNGLGDPGGQHHKGCACHQCLDLQFGWVEP